jgi:hypothetical protein
VVLMGAVRAFLGGRRWPIAQFDVCDLAIASRASRAWGVRRVPAAPALMVLAGAGVLVLASGLRDHGAA